MRVDPLGLSRRELELVSRRYLHEIIPFIGPQMDILGPDMGTNEQVMAWFMDSYSVHAGHAIREIVTGEPVSLGGVAGVRNALKIVAAASLEHRGDTQLPPLSIPPSTLIGTYFHNIASFLSYGKK